MKNWIGAFRKIAWIAALVVVTGCGQLRHSELHGLSGEGGALLMDPSGGSGASGVSGGDTINGPPKSGTTGGNPRVTRPQGSESSDPNGALTRLAVCIDLNSIRLLQDLNKATSPVSVGTGAITPVVSLQSRTIKFRVDGLKIPSSIVGADFNLVPDCKTVDGSISFDNRFATNVSSSETLHLALAGYGKVTTLVTMDVTLDASPLITALAGVSSPAQLPQLFKILSTMP